MAGFTEKNREHWDARAKTYNDKNEKTIQRMIEEIRSRLDWIGVDFLDEDEGDEEDDELADADERANQEGGSDKDVGKVERKVVRLLDYACGPGMVSRAFAPYVTSCTGIDLSSAMATVYNTAATNQGILPSEMSAVAGNLLDPDDASPADFKGEEWFNFDLAAVGLGYHHFEDPILAATRLAERLKPGGVLLIIDFLPHDHHIEPANEGDESSVWPEKADGSSHSHSHSQSHSHGHDHGHNHHGFGHGHGNGHGHGSENGLLQQTTDTIAHFGFEEEDIKKYFETAGVGKDFKFDVIAKGVVFSFEERKMTRTIFMAKGVKG